ncbi:hypothetical protein FKM82_024290 [Ascaphus truei]
MRPVTPPVSPLLRRPVGGASASDRLEADKAKYVKTPQVIERRQNPALNASLTPATARRLLPPHRGCEPQANYAPCASLSPTMPRRPLSPQWGHEPQRDPAPCASPTPAMPQRHLPPHRGHMPQTVSTLNTSLSPATPRRLLTPHQDNELAQAPSSPTATPLCLRRVSGRRLRRPDSLIIYRQRRDVTPAGKENGEAGAGLVLRLFHGSPLLKRSSTSTHGPPQNCPRGVPTSPKTQSRMGDTTVCKTPPFSDLPPQEAAWEECVNLPSSDSRRFFESCGLEGSLLNLLESFYPIGGDVTPLGSLGSVDGRSGGSGVQQPEGEREEKSPVSVIERNARVIKWIYSCQRARNMGGHGERQGPRESTV